MVFPLMAAPFGLTRFTGVPLLLPSRNIIRTRHGKRKPQDIPLSPDYEYCTYACSLWRSLTL